MSTEPRSDAEDASRWRDLMAYFDTWPHGPYTDIEQRALIDQIRMIRDRDATFHEVIETMRERLQKAYLPAPIVQAALIQYASEIRRTHPDANIDEILEAIHDHRP